MIKKQKKKQKHKQSLKSSSAINMAVSVHLRVFHLCYYQWKHSDYCVDINFKRLHFLQCWGWSKHHYHGNDPLSHEVDKGRDSCPSKPSQSTIQLCYTPSKPTAACVRLLPLVCTRSKKRVCLHLCARVCPGKG